jgi:hypothetical protein
MVARSESNSLSEMMSPSCVSVSAVILLSVLFRLETDFAKKKIKIKKEKKKFTKSGIHANAKKYFRRIRNVDYVTPDMLKSSSRSIIRPGLRIKGFVTRQVECLNPKPDKAIPIHDSPLVRPQLENPNLRQSKY